MPHGCDTAIFLTCASRPVRAALCKPPENLIPKGMLLQIAQLGQPVLWQKTTEVLVDEIGAPAFQQLLRDMLETLREAQGAGLAAPQVFLSRRVFLAVIEPPSGEDASPPIEVFINPRIVAQSVDVSESWEGCLSFPELLVKVARPRAVRIEYLNAYVEPAALELREFPARVVQHELDHLDGILTIDRAVSSRHIIKASEIDTVRDAESSHV
ncbi:MAG: peptide deformylase [Planctomycetes bacterium]|nr:peptide deformylase [Planctomycetota bacterium]